MPLYELALMGAPSGGQIDAVETCLSNVIDPFGLRLGAEVSWTARSVAFDPDPRTPAAAAFFGEPGVRSDGVRDLLARGIPIIPVAREAGTVSADLPHELRPFNCLTFSGDGALRIATSLLECVGLLPRQRRVGAALTDNSYDEDGYRFHDLFHLSLAASLGWSPVIRALLHRKRRSDPLLDEVEDGGRAVAIEEGIAALVFTYASQHSMLDGVKTIDWGLLQTCSSMTLGLEVRRRQLFAWEQSIIRAYDAWRVAIQDGGVRVFGDLIKREFRSERLR